MSNENPAPLDLSRYEGHTPGPWGYSYTITPSGTEFLISGGGGLVVDGVGGDAITACAENVRLIADAPALLAEVKRLRAEIQRIKIEHAPASMSAEEWQECGEHQVLIKE